MTIVTRTDLAAFARALESAQDRVRGFGWCTARTPLPGGRRYVIADGVVYMDARLSGNGFVSAFCAAVDELLAGGVEGATIIPFPPRAGSPGAPFSRLAGSAGHARAARPPAPASVGHGSWVARLGWNLNDAKQPRGGASFGRVGSRVGDSLRLSGGKHPTSRDITGMAWDVRGLGKSIRARIIRAAVFPANVSVEAAGEGRPNVCECQRGDFVGNRWRNEEI